MWCDELEFDEWEEKYDCDEKVMQYLHGHCDDWVNEYYQPGDKCIAITEYRDESKQLCLMHSCLFRDGKYVDVRGETEDFDNVLEAFDWGEYNVEIYDTLQDFNQRMKKLGIR